jgi:hypothetical protein
MGASRTFRGLWKGGERFYARLTVENPVTEQKKKARVPLVGKQNNPVQTVPQATAELDRLRTEPTRRRAIGRTAKLGDYARTYFENIGAGEGAKAPATVDKESTIWPLDRVPRGVAP